MLQKLRKQEEGFTIIEVLIVLAIAGLILLIVFLAVPALQRSARNTQRKNDASAIASAIADYIDNNGGTVLGAVKPTGTDLLICGSSCASGNTQTAKLGFYDPSKISVANGSAGSVTPSVGTDSVVIETGESCDSTGTAGGSASPRTAAVFYAVETGSSSSDKAEQCVEQ
jgi:type IV pilus assembly protein PilA